MGFDVLRADVDNVDAWLVTYTNDIASSLQAVTEGAQELSGLASFTGSTAEAVKAYWGEAHVLATAAIALAGMELAMRCTEYAQGYDGIDANKNARFSQDALETTSTDYQGKQTDFADKDVRLKTAVDAVSDLIGSWTPSAAAITDNLSSLATDPSTLCSSVSAYEATSASGLAVSVDALLADAQSLVELLTAGTGGAAYVPGTIASQPWVADLYAAIQTSQTYQEEHSAAYEAAIAGLQGRMQERYDEYVAAEAEARRQAGIVEMGTAVLTVLAGAAAIVFTAGAATPVVVGLFAVSTAFQASNFIEGYNDFQLGSAGDITTAAFNPLRDTIFFGNQEIYDGATFVATAASSLAIPVGGVMGQASTAVRAGEMTMGQAARSYGAQLAKGLVVGELQDQAVDFGLSVTADPLCYALLGDGAAGQLTAQAIHMGAGMLDPFGDGDVDVDAAPRVRTADVDVGVPRADLDFSGDLGIDATTGVHTTGADVAVPKKVVDSPGGPDAGVLAGGADASLEPSLSERRAAQLEMNRQQGRQYEIQEFAKFQRDYPNAVEQVTIKMEDGTRIRVDAIAVDGDGNIHIQEYKSSHTATYTKNQGTAFGGDAGRFTMSGTIVGKKGTSAFGDGLAIPEGTRVTIVKPGHGR